MKILVVDDHVLIREGMRQVLKGLADDVNVLEAGTARQALQLADAHPDLDLVLLDFRLPDMDGLVALEAFASEHPELPILVVSGTDSPPLIEQAMRRGAAGFLTKSGRSDELLDAARRVLDGELLTPLPSALQGHNPQPPATDAPQFTPRQLEVLFLLLEGRTNKEIGRSMQLSDETVKNHVTAILRGFGVNSRTQAVLAARRHGYYAKSSPLN